MDMAAAPDRRRGIGAPSVVPGAGDARGGEEVLLRACIANERECLEKLDIVLEAHALRGGVAEGEVGDPTLQLAVDRWRGLLVELPIGEHVRCREATEELVAPRRLNREARLDLRLELERIVGERRVELGALRRDLLVELLLRRGDRVRLDDEV